MSRWRRVRFGIVTRLTLVVIPLVLLPLGGLAYVWYSSTKATLEAQIREELQVRLRQVALRLKPFLRERELDLYDLTSSPALRDYQTQLEYRLVQEADVALKKLSDHFAQFLSRRDEVVAEARYLDETGKELVERDRPWRQAEQHRALRGRAVLPAGQGAPSRLGRARLRRAVGIARDHGPASGPADLQRVEGIPGRDGRRSADVVLHVDAGGRADGRPGTSFLVDGSGAILGPPGSAETLAERWRGPGELSEILRTPPGDPQVVDLAGGGHGLLVRAVVGAHGWTVGVLAPLAEIEAPVRALTQSTLAYGSAGAIVLVLAVVLVARGASRRVRRLQAATAQLAKGHFGLRMPAEGSDEVGDLGRSFNLMAESLARRDAELGAQDRGSAAAAPGARGPQRGHPGGPYLAGPAGEPRGHPRSPDGALRLHGGRDPAARRVARQPDPRRAPRSPAELRRESGSPAHGRGPLGGRRSRLGKPLLLSEPADIAPYRDRVPEGTTVGGILLIPILSKGQALGAVVLIGQRKPDFTDAEFSLFGSIGLEVGTAIQNARLFSQTQALLAEAERHRARAEALAEIGRSVTATLDLDRVLDLVVERVSVAMGADAVSILRLDGNTLHYVRTRGLPAGSRDLAGPRARGRDDRPAARAGLERGPARRSPLRREPQRPGPVQDGGRARGACRPGHPRRGRVGHPRRVHAPALPVQPRGGPVRRRRGAAGRDRHRQRQAVRRSPIRLCAARGRAGAGGPDGQARRPGADGGRRRPRLQQPARGHSRQGRAAPAADVGSCS